jgi:hypothetical protein
MRAMTMPTAPYNGTASVTQIINQPLSTVGPHRVHTEPPPPPRKPHHKTYAHARRPNSNAARRGAYNALKNAGKLPDIKPDDVMTSPTSQASRPQSIYGQARDWFCSAAAPSHAVLDRTREGLRQYAGYFPNAFGIAFRAWSASFVETVRSTCLGPYDPAAEATSPSTDPATTLESLDRSPEWVTARTLENAAVAFYHVMESEFGSAPSEQPMNATLQTTEDSQLRAAVTPGSENFKEAVSKIVSLPTIMDNRPCLAFEDMMRRIDGEFIFYGKADMFRGQSIQGKIVVISPVLRDSLGSIRDVLNDISRNNDILLSDAYLPPTYLPRKIKLDENGVASSPNAMPEDHWECLGIDPSRCFIWDATDPALFDREMILEMSEIALDTIARSPARTVFVITDSLSAAEFMRLHEGSGVAIRLEQLR